MQQIDFLLHLFISFLFLLLIFFKFCNKSIFGCNYRFF